MRVHRGKTALLATVLVLPSFVGRSVTAVEPSGISSTILKAHVEFLGSDQLAGRAAGAEGSQKAADYLSLQLRQFGLRPLGRDNSYFQDVPLRASIPLEDSRFLVQTAKGRRVEFALSREYLLYTSGSQTFIPNPVPLVFAGYGIVAPEYDYNDYQSLDVEDSVVVFLEGEPESSNPSYFDGEAPTIHSYPEIKRRVALSRGARGSLLIPSPRRSHPDWRDRVREFAFEHVTLAYGAAGNLSAVVNPESAGVLFAGAPHQLDEVLEMEAEGVLRSFPLKTRMSFRGSFRQREFLGTNVIALLEGSDPELRETYLLISAHYDHLGIGPEIRGDSIYNGVFDNASGVAGVLELARVLSSRSLRPRRSVVFLFTTAEEKGLLGAYYYAEHPAVPLHRTIANVNVDGLALFDTFRSIIGVGAELSTLGENLEATARELELTVTRIPPQFRRAEAFTRSDQAALAEAGIPSILIMEGLDYEHLDYESGMSRFLEWSANVYHTPFDDLSQTLDYAAARQHCEVILNFSLHLLDNEAEPSWRPGIAYNQARLRSIAERR